MRLLSAALLLVLLGCSIHQSGASPEGNIVAPTNFRAGSGVISSVAVLSHANKNAAAGSREKPDPNLYRLSLQMDNDGFQQVDVDNAGFVAGQAVELTNDGRVVLVTGTALNKALAR